MEIRLLQENEIANASGLSRFVFDNCLRNRMSFAQTIHFVEEYITEANLRKMYQDETLLLWGVYEQEQLVGVGGLQSNGMLTMLYVLPQFWGRKYGTKLLFAIREYVRDVLQMERITVNATPAWTAAYFVKQGFSYVEKKPNMYNPFVSLYALSEKTMLYKKERITGKTIAIAAAACVGIATVVSSLFMIFYLF